MSKAMNDAVNVYELPDAPRSSKETDSIRVVELRLPSLNAPRPVAPARLFTAVSRVKQRLGTPPARLESTLAQITSSAQSPAKQYLRWINASVGQSLKLITVDEVTYFQADNKYTRVVTGEGEALIRKPLKELVEELDPNQFWQIHRSTLVNATSIAGVARDFRGRMLVKLKTRAETLLVSDSYTHLFRQM